jgi:precorrin-6A synthase
MRKILIIGIGAGHPDYITIQAVNAMQQAQVFFVTDKGSAKADLVRARTAICERHLAANSYRIVTIADPERDRAPPAYESAVSAWHEQRRVLYEQLIATELGEHDCGAFLVWGDPALYDSTLRIVQQIAARGTIAFEFEVIPGITAIQALTARHRIPLNSIATSVRITTGRQLASATPLVDEDQVVLLDGKCAFKDIAADGVDIYWGAYLGTEDEILISGELNSTAGEIERVRAAVRERKGWIMDTYLLRRTARKQPE